MSKQFKQVVRIFIAILAGVVFATALPSCKANKCDCPTFGGHRLKHT